MLRKIHSNRDPGDTLQSQIRKEFQVYFIIIGNALKRRLVTYPKFCYGLMVILLLASMVLSFTICRYPDKASIVTGHQINPVSEGFSRIMAASGKLRGTLLLKHLVDSISSKKSLTAKDTSTLDSALERLQQITNP
jgi:hypothetical protein